MKELYRPKKHLLQGIALGFSPAILIFLFLAFLNGASLQTSLLGLLLVSVACIGPLILFIYTSDIELDTNQVKLGKLLSSRMISISDIKSVSLYKRGSYVVVSVKYTQNGKQEIASLGDTAIYKKQDLMDLVQKIRNLNSSIVVSG
jgi:hypothetical protein